MIQKFIIYVVSIRDENLFFAFGLLNQIWFSHSAEVEKNQ